MVIISFGSRGSGFWVYVSDFFILFLTPFNLSASLSVEGCIGIQGRRKETKIPFRFQIYFRVFNDYTVVKRFSLNQWKWSGFQNNALKYICHFRRVMSLRSVVMSSRSFSVRYVRQWQLASSNHNLVQSLGAWQIGALPN